MKKITAKTVLIFGGDGMFAYDMYHVLKNDKRFEPISLSKNDLDIMIHDDVSKIIKTEKPYAVINTVGPPVDICEENQEFAKQINVDSVKNCAIACNLSGTRFFHLSTCGLFGDKKDQYKEKDSVVLKTVYAKTKFDGEKEAITQCANTIIVRPGWMYGGTIHHKKNFVVGRIKEMKNLKKIKSAKDKFGNPTWTFDAAKAVLSLLANDPLKGIFNLANSGGGSRADYIEAITKFANLSIAIGRVDSSFFPRKSNVPDCELLDVSYLNSLIETPMRNWRVALKDYISSLDINKIINS